MKIVQTPGPPVKADEKRATSPSVAEQQLALSQDIIPAVPGEFYSYRSHFGGECPLYALMKCKSNKARPTCQAKSLGMEANAFFHFTDADPRVLSIKAACASGMLKGVEDHSLFGETWFAPTDLTIEEFKAIHSQKDADLLVEACRKSFGLRQVVIDLHQEQIVAMMTDGGKYGLFMVEEMTNSTVQIAACHVLL